MPCHYPQGPEEEWCERHRIDDAFIRELRAAAAESLKRRGRIGAL